jgi:hypothetical protein
MKRVQQAPDKDEGEDEPQQAPGKDEGEDEPLSPERNCEERLLQLTKGGSQYSY